MNFKQDVIEQSFKKPVLVDFWAPWCSPCRILGPVIEKIASEQADQWTLIKLNTEEEQELAQEYGIRSIPNVKMFFKGEVIAEFSGALTRPKILDWLAEHLPSEQKASLHAILEKLDSDQEEEAIKELKVFLGQHPDMLEGAVALGQKIVFAEAELAKELVEDIKLGSPLFDQAEDIRQLANLAIAKFDDSAAGQKLLVAKTQMQNGEIEAMAKALIEAVTIDKQYANELARKVAIALFRTLGNQHPISKNYRWRFDMALY